MSPLFDRLRDFFKGVGKPPGEPLAPPADDSPASVERWLAASGLGDERARQLVALALPAIRLRVTDMAVDDWPAVATSKLGGLPDVPAGWTWPEFDGLPLMFVAQVNLAELARMPAARELPSEGVLAFFWHPGREGAWGSDPKDRGSARVYWFEDARVLRRAPRPGTLPADGAFAAARLAMREVLTLPDSDDPAVEALGLNEEERELYAECASALHMPGSESTQHQLLGHAAPIQGDMTHDCARATRGLGFADAQRLPVGEQATLEAEARRWRLLAQVDSEGANDMMWGDAGMLYFWMRDDDLAARRFDRAWMVMQCA